MCRQALSFQEQVELRGKNLNCGIRGGLWDEAHLERMGPAVWLFGWLVHRQTREHNGVGLVLGGSPLTYKIISQDTGMAERTLKRWMARLGRSGYVRVKHTTYKRMIIQITKAKKFGPQQLRFPQGSFFAQESKGPLPALEGGSKGPMVARSRKEYREYKPERHTSNGSPCGNCACERERAGQNTSRCFPYRENNKPSSEFPNRRDRPSPSISPPGSRSYDNSEAPRPYAPSYRDSDAYRAWQSERAWREAKLRAELYVGTGPEVPHPPKAGRET